MAEVLIRLVYLVFAVLQWVLSGTWVARPVRDVHDIGKFQAVLFQAMPIIFCIATYQTVIMPYQAHC